MMVQNILFGWRNDQEHKPGSQAIIRLRAGTRHKMRLRWVRPTREVYEAYLGRTSRMQDPWGLSHTVLEVLPETEPVWRDVRGFVVVATDGSQIRVIHSARGLSFWFHRSRVFTPGRYQLHDWGEDARWTTVEFTEPVVGGEPHLHVEVAEEGEGR